MLTHYNNDNKKCNYEYKSKSRANGSAIIDVKKC